MTTSKTFTVDVPVRWGDMDAYGHINNVAIVRLMEEARVAVFGAPPSAGQLTAHSPKPLVPFFDQFEDGVQALIADHSIKYRQQLPYRAQPVRVEVGITKVTAASMTVNYSLIDQETSTECVSANTTLAFFNVNTGGIVRIAPELRQRLNDLA